MVISMLTVASFLGALGAGILLGIAFQYCKNKRGRFLTLILYVGCYLLNMNCQVLQWQKEHTVSMHMQLSHTQLVTHHMGLKDAIYVLSGRYECCHKFIQVPKQHDYCICFKILYTPIILHTLPKTPISLCLSLSQVILKPCSYESLAQL